MTNWKINKYWSEIVLDKALINIMGHKYRDMLYKLSWLSDRHYAQQKRFLVDQNVALSSSGHIPSLDEEWRNKKQWPSIVLNKQKLFSSL